MTRLFLALVLLPLLLSPVNEPVLPYPGAPACAAHEPADFHTLWDADLGCHYDHEHGQDPFTAAVAATFPNMDLQALLGGVQVGHTNPSSPIEFTDKHGGLKWNVQLAHPQVCAGFEGAVTGVNGSVIQYHGFGRNDVELEARLHSTVALLRQCRAGNPTDYGYVFVNQLQDYGQRITPYQGTILPYPNQPAPAYPSARGPYLSQNCVDLLAPFVVQCRAGLAQAQANNSDEVWTSKVTYGGHSATPTLFRLLWRVRDAYQNIVWEDAWTYPFEFRWLCTSDGGLTYDPAGCRYTNTTTQVHEIAGVIPASWDNLAGWDTEPEAGRVTVDGFVDQNGQPTAVCEAPGVMCYPIKLVRAFTGSYGSVLVFTAGSKGTNVVPYLPSRNLYFDGAPSGWVGAGN